MQDYLVLRLTGPMQAWGLPTFEGTRPCATFPGRSGLLGLLAACLGIKRNDRTRLKMLADSVRFAVRCDNHLPYRPTYLTDFHTVKDAREKAGGLKMNDTIITRREYLCDASFSVVVWTPSGEGQGLTLDVLTAAVQKPVYTPYLGRRSCPLTHPLFHCVINAENPACALASAIPGSGVIYSEEAISGDERRLPVRDEPIFHLPRQFTSRTWFVIQQEETCF
ncbi:type I-E CRISPR-associated protein Cas5/CasD [Erwinia sp. OLTSP20]|uniref:type I-E CRISPR-associated protein Cas5/CasD n=1 Tax=unclassified Erwinia TaxID=2622719 RepID=UPI000C1A82A8|nr:MULTISPECIES: type I-E CRISPR-associated protein Cas5/CasD [unclassified Erwinia]PIJ49776.1 type I-E CRISPR-associated protein Cas5/CasD [Erwinia sp. OAMSP11]PIJ70875.1 type I-E CRISPR-associated protein Cas5/CasD [Erwinia sp. OLSSP12]PIJ80240.1 type I-E CRISPR-associated protein Cas5/CasD [Erwinia sp. OLCASP19]PIJ82364.1 type I-E CRISPR-associated protein Cas5/CasD [Erwinia sp. OLMTSP26]PIJ85050.1 type I-E CRISPR-associated protein Cas5/CasD [Erwinia sp. OLMDSP33]